MLTDRPFFFPPSKPRSRNTFIERDTSDAMAIALSLFPNATGPLLESIWPFAVSNAPAPEDERWEGSDGVITARLINPITNSGIATSATRNPFISPLTGAGRWRRARIDSAAAGLIRSLSTSRVMSRPPRALLINAAMVQMGPQGIPHQPSRPESTE